MKSAAVRYFNVGLVVSLLAVLCCACQSSVRMTRPDADASLSRPGDWLDEQDTRSNQERPNHEQPGEKTSSGVLFQIRHPIEPVRVRLQRLERPIIAQAHEPWARLWLEATFGNVAVETAEATTLGASTALKLVSRATDEGESLAHELILANAGSETYILEAWGSPEAMRRSSTARRQVVESVKLPSDGGAPSTVQPGPMKPETVSHAHFRLVLPAVADVEVDATWDIEQVSDDRIIFKLPSHLIEGEVLTEALDYPIDASTYAETALGVDVGDKAAAGGDVVVRGVNKGDGRPSMHTTRRFLTRGERGVQIAVSTPEALYETNSNVIDRLVETLEIVEDAE